MIIDCNRGNSRAGYVVVLVLGLIVVSLMTLGAVLSWTVSSARSTARSNERIEAQLAAESATEKILATMVADFQSGGAWLVNDRLRNYRGLVPSSADDPIWNDWLFSDAQNGQSRTFVQQIGSETWTNLSSQYTGLRGMAANYQILSNARRVGTQFDVVGAVNQEIQLASIPVFQFAVFYGVDCEISCGQPMTVIGRVHSNKGLWIEPDNSLTFASDVTAVGTIHFGRMPGDLRHPPVGGVTYKGAHDSRSASYHLPIGTNNSPEVVRSILEIPPPTEPIRSPMGSERFYNNADLIIVASSTAVLSGRSGSYNNFSTLIGSSQIESFASLSPSFYDQREMKTVRPIQIDVGKLAAWSATNTVLRASLGRDLRTVYVADFRNVGSGNLAAVRLINGATLPPLGLTLATARPIYVQGNYNCPNAAHLGTTNTSATVPAALVGDALTILSTAWQDSNSALSLSHRTAAHTTVNAAFLAGIVETSTHGRYSGGLENFPRFLENWSSSRFTYNGSMVVMFPSQFATEPWGKPDVYSPPSRDWSFDSNFLDAASLPPSTPAFRTAIRKQWQLLSAGRTR